MHSKRPQSSKRTSLPRAFEFTKDFIKDWKRLTHSGRYDLNRLKEAMLQLIANGSPLGQEWKDHSLKGGWEGHRECHIGGDFLLVYSVNELGKIVFTRAGTHADLFE